MFNPDIKYIVNNNHEFIPIKAVDFDAIAPTIATIIILFINMLIIGLFITVVYVMCSITPLFSVLHHIYNHINWVNVFYIATGVLLFSAFVYYTKDITDKIDRVFANLSQEIAEKDYIIKQLKNEIFLLNASNINK